MHLLVIEDERVLCETIVRSLRRLAYSVDHCYDGDKALELLGTERYDLVLLDLNLPGKDGMTVLRTFRQRDRKTPVLILSARSEVKDKVEGFLHTHDVKKYAMRLGLFALLSEIPFDLAFSSKILEFNYQNVFFTLFIGLLTMIAYRAVEEKEEWNQALKVILYILIVAAGMALAYFLKTDYAEKGVFCIMVLYIFRKKKMWQLIAGCASFIWETPALFGFIPIAFYNGTRGWKMKYFFYIFYPAHLLILYLLCYFMGISGYSAV